MSSTKEQQAQAMIEPKMAKSANDAQIASKQNEPKEVLKEEEVVLNTETPILRKSRPARYVSKINVIDDLERPNFDLLMKKMDEIHARNDQHESYSCWETCCIATPGSHGCFDTSMKSDFDKFGVGVVHYFRFVKYLTWFFFFASILAIPSLYFAIESADALSTETLMNYKGILYFTTMGSIANGVSQCSTTQLDISGSNEIEFSCPRGTIGISTFEYGRVIEPKTLTCERFTAYSWDTKCNNQKDAAEDLEKQYKKCSDKSDCSFEMKRSYFNFENPECSAWDPLNENYDSSNKGFYFQILCQDIQFRVPGGKLIDKEKAGWIIVTLDFCICVLYLLFLLILGKREKEAVNHVTGNNDAIDTYTIQVKTLPTMTMAELRAQLWSHFSAVEVEGKTIKIKVVDVQLAESNVLLKLNENLGTVRAKKVRMYRDFYRKWARDTNMSMSEVDFEGLEKLANEKGKKALKNFKPIRKLKGKQEKLQEKINKMKNYNKSDVVSAFITFEDKKHRDLVYSYHQSSPLTRCCFPVCCCGYQDDPNVFKGSYLNVIDAPIPSNIIWTNMGAGKFDKFLRRLLSWVITIALWAISFGFMVYVRNEQNDAAKTVKPTKDCSGSEYVNLTPAMVATDTDHSLGYVECYCRADFARALSDSLCHDWTIDKVLTEGLPFLIVFAIIVINYVLQIVFKLLTSFERHRSNSSESVSRILKIFVAQALNTGIILLIVNAKVANENASKILAGTFDDVSPQWFYDVGTTLLTTMIINVINLPVVSLLLYIVTSCSRCWDRGCSYDKNVTRKKSQSAWENLYTGPEFLIEFRYAQILTVVFISLFYSSGIPVLFISTFLNLLAFYWTDKIYLLRICRLPKALDKKLQSMVRQTLFFAALLQLGKAIWVYGNPKIFGDSTSLKVASDFFDEVEGGEAPNIFVTVYNRAIIEHNLSLAGLFVLIVVAILTMIFFQNTVKRVFNICHRRRGKQTKNTDKYKDINPYYGRIKYDDLLSEKKYLEKEILTIRYEKLKELLEQRLQRIEAEIELRYGATENMKDKFQGIFSYSISHNPDFKKWFEAKGLQEDASPDS